jgi:very-short-patch-repair endonuclease
MAVKIPRPLSPGEETFALHCKAISLYPVREYVFARPRKWKFDFAFPEQKIAVEIEGGIWRGGRHNRATGYETDLEKYNAAVLLGWRVLRYSTDMVIAGDAIEGVSQLLFGEQSPA